MSKSVLPSKLAFVDIETTGGSLSRDRIIEIGIIRVELVNGQYQVTKTLNSLINPDQYLPPEISLLTGIQSHQLEAAPYFYELKEQIQETFANCLLVAHNVRFDYSFLKSEFYRLNINFDQKHFCTVKLSRKLFPQYAKHNLDSLIERFNFKMEHRHRALDDADILWQFWQLLVKTQTVEQLITSVNFVLKKPSLPTNLPAEILDSLPETSGVYIFYGDNQIPLYVGKSINIRDRVLSHFAADLKSGIEMKISQQIKHIETITTTGELGALLKEATLVKQLQPLYNRKLRHTQRLALIIKKVDKNNYSTTYIEVIDQIPLDNLDNIVGIFRSIRQAKNFLIKMAKEHQLCEKKLSTEIGNGACFSYRLGKCHGACQNQELPAQYNLRFFKAFANVKLRPWPFTGPIIIKEQHPINGQIVNYLVDNWCLLGNYDTEQQITLEPIDKADVLFDLDAYKILNSFIRLEKNRSKISTLTPRQQKQLIAQPTERETYIQST